MGQSCKVGLPSLRVVLPTGASVCLIPACSINRQLGIRRVTQASVCIAEIAVTMTIFAGAGEFPGIRFRRVDLADKPEIEARVENVTENNHVRQRSRRGM